jgi:hypothetical protein
VGTDEKDTLFFYYSENPGTLVSVYLPRNVMQICLIRNEKLAAPELNLVTLNTVRNHNIAGM